MASFQKVQSPNKAKPFCKVCHDAGKPIEVYTSHFVKSDPGPKGKVVCPTLLEQACTFCHTNGHTVSYCMELKMRNKDRRRQDFKKKEEPKKTKKLTRKNAFLELMEDSDSDNESVVAEVNVIKIEEFPALCQQTNVSKQQGMSYANMAAKPVVKMAATLPEPVQVAAEEDDYEHIPQIKRQEKMRSWADWSDSDDDDDVSVLSVSNDAW